MNAATSLLILALIAPSALAQPKESIETRLDRLEAENRYLRDYLDIWKLQSLYVQYMNINAPKEIVALFADSPDVEIELSNKGILRGRDAPHRYFLRAGTAQAITETGSRFRADFYNPFRVDKTNPFDPPPPSPYRD